LSGLAAPSPPKCAVHCRRSGRRMASSDRRHQCRAQPGMTGSRLMEDSRWGTAIATPRGTIRQAAVYPTPVIRVSTTHTPTG
jgi:hypothetical protein